MHFREANVNDIREIQIVRNRVKENTLSDPGLVTDADCEDFLTVRGKGWVCEAGDHTIVGFAIADLQENNIWALFMEPEFEKKGIGRRLHDMMLDWYFSQTIETVWLGTAFNTRAEKFYRRAGWKEVGMHGTKEIKFEMTHDMWKELQEKEKSEDELILTKTIATDLETLFTFQTDEEGIQLAAFTPKDPCDKSAYINKYTPFLTDPTINMMTIKKGKEIVGSVSKYEMHGDAEITYWIDRKYWGQGIASQALKAFLDIETTRPIYGRAAFDNYGSQRVMEKCGFVKIGTDKGFANARQEEIEEVIYKLP